MAFKEHLQNWLLHGETHLVLDVLKCISKKLSKRLQAEIESLSNDYAELLQQTKKDKVFKEKELDNLIKNLNSVILDVDKKISHVQIAPNERKRTVILGLNPFLRHNNSHLLGQAIQVLTGVEMELKYLGGIRVGGIKWIQLPESHAGRFVEILNKEKPLKNIGLIWAILLNKTKLVWLIFIGLIGLLCIAKLSGQIGKPLQPSVPPIDTIPSPPNFRYVLSLRVEEANDSDISELKRKNLRNIGIVLTSGAFSDSTRVDTFLTAEFVRIPQMLKGKKAKVFLKNVPEGWQLVVDSVTLFPKHDTILLQKIRVKPREPVNEFIQVYLDHPQGFVVENLHLKPFEIRNSPVTVPNAYTKVTVRKGKEYTVYFDIGKNNQTLIPKKRSLQAYQNGEHIQLLPR